MIIREPHVVVIPYPAQGHVLPLMSFSQYLARQGIRVTFINTEHNHHRIISAMNKNCDYIEDHRIKLVSIPDGLEDSPEDRNIPGRLSTSVMRLMPARVEELIEEIIATDRGSGCDSINCVVADQSLGWAIEIAAKFGIKCAAFCPAAAASMALGFSLQKLVDDGVVDLDGNLITVSFHSPNLFSLNLIMAGTPRANKRIRLFPGMPETETSEFVWICLKNRQSQANIFQLMLRNTKTLHLIDWVLCNSVYELESPTFQLFPQFQPIGPIGFAHIHGASASSAGSFWEWDSECLDWLDRQETGSVIYVAFGSIGFIGQAQFDELAFGLKLTNRPVLWVTGAEQTEKLATTISPTRVKVVAWAPQRAVLGHRAIGCFVSHCGWNSVIEGAANGVAFLCWPIFADQFTNMTYICDVWKTGVRVEKDKAAGMVLRSEVKKKIEEVMGDGECKKRAMEVKQIVMTSVAHGGISHVNLHNFVSWIKGCS